MTSPGKRVVVKKSPYDRALDFGNAYLEMPFGENVEISAAITPDGGAGVCIRFCGGEHMFTIEEARKLIKLAGTVKDKDPMFTHRWQLLIENLEQAIPIIEREHVTPPPSGVN